MKILVLGAQGMAGHIIVDFFRNWTNWEIWEGIRTQPHSDRQIQIQIPDEVLLQKILHEIKPDVVINTIGILNEQVNLDLHRGFEVNSLLPHRLVEYAKTYQYKVVHISTDCVFSGEKGSYVESDLPDATTWYGRTKAWGEIRQDPHITIRTSIIGPELKTDGIGLFHWFFQQHGKVFGYKNVWWNGVTTLELAKAIYYVLNQPTLSGLVHLTAPNKIEKIDLLHETQRIFAIQGIEIEPSIQSFIDKSLKNTRSEFEFKTSSYSLMLQELKDWMIQSDRNYNRYLERCR